MILCTKKIVNESVVLAHNTIASGLSNMDKPEVKKQINSANKKLQYEKLFWMYFWPLKRPF